MSEQQKFVPGDVVYFKHATRLPRRSSDGFRAGHGHAYGLLLGIKPPFSPEVTSDLVFRICASFGMVTMDSIIELMGPAIANEYLTRLHAKYAEPAAEQPAAEPKPTPGKLIGLDGKPLGAKPTLIT